MSMSRIKLVIMMLGSARLWPMIGIVPPCSPPPLIGVTPSYCLLSLILSSYSLSSKLAESLKFFDSIAFITQYQ